MHCQPSSLYPVVDISLYCQTETAARTDILSQPEQLKSRVIKTSPAFQSFGVYMYVSSCQIKEKC